MVNVHAVTIMAVEVFVLVKEKPNVKIQVHAVCNHTVYKNIFWSFGCQRFTLGFIFFILQLLNKSRIAK